MARFWRFRLYLASPWPGFLELFVTSQSFQKHLKSLSKLFGDFYSFLESTLVESVFDFGTFELGNDKEEGYLPYISLIIDVAYLVTILTGFLALFGKKQNESTFYFYNISLSCLFVMAAAFFIAICGVILKQNRNLQPFEWLGNLIMAYCKSLIVILGIMSTLFIFSIAAGIAVYAKLPEEDVYETYVWVLT